MIQSTFASYTPVGTPVSQRAEGIPVGARGSIALGSGLRSGMVLVDVAGQATAELHEVRKALAEADREAVRSEARRQFSEEVRARTDPDPEEAADVGTDGAQGQGEALQAGVAAQLAAAGGETAGRGSFVNLAV